MTRNETISEILKLELLLSQQTFAGHKHTTGDEYHNVRERLN